MNRGGGRFAILAGVGELPWRAGTSEEKSSPSPHHTFRPNQMPDKDQPITAIDPIGRRSLDRDMCAIQLVLKASQYFCIVT